VELRREFWASHVNLILEDPQNSWVHLWWKEMTQHWALWQTNMKGCTRESGTLAVDSTEKQTWGLWLHWAQEENGFWNRWSGQWWSVKVAKEGPGNTETEKHPLVSQCRWVMMLTRQHGCKSVCWSQLGEGWKLNKSWRCEDSICSTMLSKALVKGCTRGPHTS
jgi:hypothetical protein